MDMAPIEFEKQIKEKLDERKIKPSKATWDKIKDKIEVPTSRKKTGFIRYAVAAAIIGIFSSVLWISNKSENEALENLPIVDNPVDQNKEMEIIEDTDKDYQTESVEIVNITPAVKDPVSEVEVSQSPVAKNQDLALDTEHNNTEDSFLSLQAEERIDQKIAEVMAQVNFIENNQESITDAEVDSLLRNAQRELLAEKALQSEQNIDAAKLLAGVEAELDQSFRDQVFERLKNGFIKVRTAVADRNN